jgi:hypothetical protein
VAAADGLQIRSDTVVWPRWQARFGLTTAAPLNESRNALHGARLFGDYYFTGSGFNARGVTGGFRATSGLVAGPRSLALSSPTLPSRQGLTFSLSSRAVAAQPSDATDDASTVPYFGIGYTGVSIRGGWGFTADIGLVGSGVRLGRTPFGTQGNIDELLRELRLTPVLQLGVSYSF